MNLRIAFVSLSLICAVALPAIGAEETNANKNVSATKDLSKEVPKLDTPVPKAATTAPENSPNSTASSGAQRIVPDASKTAYFSNGKVEAALPSMRRRQLLKAQAESQLRQAAKEAIDALQKMRKEGKTEGEIAAEETRRKSLVELQQKALAELVGNAQGETRTEIETAVASIAEAKGLTLVLDIDGIYFGGADIRNSGRDITAEIVRKLAQ